jgi:hypothetical protein
MIFMGNEMQFELITKIDESINNINNVLNEFGYNSINEINIDFDQIIEEYNTSTSEGRRAERDWVRNMGNNWNDQNHSRPREKRRVIPYATPSKGDVVLYKNTLYRLGSQDEEGFFPSISVSDGRRGIEFLESNLTKHFVAKPGKHGNFLWVKKER